MGRKLILIADTDRAILKDLGNALHERDYEVRAARDGSKALEKAILFHPDLILFDSQCPLISAKKLIQILRTNPRTENIPVVIMGRGESDEIALWGYREAVIRKPFNTDEVLSVVASIFRKMATAREVREGGREIEGSLSQISLVDLLQIFNLNRKTGMLEVKSKEQEGRVYVQDGNVVHANTGRHHGEKSLFRMLQWHDGSFAFIAEKVTADTNIRRSTDMLLLEGARQGDELGRLRLELPPNNVRLVVLPDRVGKYEGLHPVTQEIMNLLEFYSTVGELIDHARVSDFEACRAIRTLLAKGVLQAVAEEVQEPGEEEPLLGHDQLFELKGGLSFGLSSQSRTIRGKVCLLGSDERLLKEFVAVLRKLPGVELSGQLEALRRGFGVLGTLRLSENLVLDLMLLPDSPILKPLWGPLAVGIAGGLVLRAAPDRWGLERLDNLARELSHEGRLPVVTIAPDDGGQARQAVVQLLNRMNNGLAQQKVQSSTLAETSPAEPASAGD